MPLWKSSGIALLGLIVTAAPTVGQSLADVARKEADRRKTIHVAGKPSTLLPTLEASLAGLVAP